MRLYITNTSPSYTPTTWKAAFNTTAGAVNKAFSKTKAGASATVAVAETSTTNNYKAALVRAVSEPLGGTGTLGGAFTITMARLESAAAANMGIFFRIWVTVGDTDVSRGVFYSDFAGATEFATTMTAFSFTLTGTNVAVQAGDRVVFEYGYNAANTSATSYTGTVRYGGTAGDLATTGTTGVTTNSPWVDFAATNDDLFVDYVPPAALGTYNNLFNRSYTGTAKTGDYHLYAADRTTGAPLGLVVQLHGDGAGEFPNPTTGVLAGYNTVAQGRNMIMLAPKAPDEVGSRTWWENQASPVWLLELINMILVEYPAIDTSRIWFMGYSGGAEVQTYWLLSDYSNQLGGGGNIMLGGGGAAGLVFGLQPTTAFKNTQRLHWAVGANDTDDGSGFNAFAASQGGYDRYGTEGFAIRSREVIPGMDHFQSEGEGPRILGEQLALAYDTPGNVAAVAATGSSAALAPAVSGGGGGGGAVALAGTATIFEADAATDVVVAYPSGITAGELLILTCANSQSTAPTTVPAGWTLAIAQNGTTAPSISVWYKVADGSETGNLTIAGANTAAGKLSAAMSRWSGVNTSAPMDATPTGATTGVAVTFNTPTITTATNGAMLIHVVGINASGLTNDINTSAGTTNFSATTGVGRIHKGFYEARPTAGATGGRTWDKVGATALQWAGVTLALRPGSSGPVTPTLNRCVQDVPATTTHTIKVNTTDATSVRIKAATNSALTTGVVYGSAVTPDSNSNAELTISGLTPGTAYFYRIGMTNSGVETEDTWTDVGQFKTNTNGQMDFSFGFGSCVNNSDSAALGAIAVKKPDLFFHLGDEWYADGSGTSIANFRSKMGDKVTATNHKAVYRTSGATWTPSDHDAMNNNGNYSEDPTAWTNWNQVVREMKPAAPLPTTMGVYRTFTRGRIRFIILDRRSFADLPANTDNSGKTCLGATQKQWFKDQIDAATEPVIIVHSDAPWIITSDPGDDGWGGYITERDELASHITSSGKNVAFICGDMHALAAEDGSGSPGGCAVFQAAPFYQYSSQKGGPYDVGPYPAGYELVQQYGWMDVDDNGTSISLIFKGFSSDNTQRVTLTKTYSVAAPATVAAVVATATATDIVPVVSGAVTVVGVDSTATAQTIAPAVSGSQVITSVRAQASSLALVPAVTTVGSVVGIRAQASSLMRAPGVLGAQVSSVASPVFVVTSQALAPTIAITGALTGTLMSATSVALAPSIGVSPIAVAVKASGTSAAIAPAVSAGHTVAAVVSTGTSAVHAPSFIGGAVVGAVDATATGYMRTPAVAAFAGMVTPAPTLLATATAPSPTVSAPGVHAAVVATGTASAISPVATGLASVIAQDSTATATMRIPGVTAGGVAGAQAVAATATATAHPASVTVGIIVGAPAMSASSTTPEPTVSALAVIQSAKATASAQVQVPALALIVGIVATQMVATAMARNPGISSASLANAVVATATAVLLNPHLLGDKEFYLKDGTRLLPYMLIGGILVPVDPQF